MISIGRLRAPYVDDVAHYTKLLGRYTRLTQIELRESPAHEAAGEHLAARLPRGAFVSLLAAEGEQLDSIAFASFIEARRASGRDLAFVIGGAHHGGCAGADRVVEGFERRHGGSLWVADLGTPPGERRPARRPAGRSALSSGRALRR